jgi:putative ABC transport system ATP-binding protein
VILDVKEVKKSFRQGGRDIPVLQGAALSLKAGDTLAILGQSGSGKSTLLSILCGLMPPDHGSITLMGHSIAGAKEEEWTSIRARDIGVVFQNFHLLPHLTALENVALALEIRGLPNAELLARESLARVGLSERIGHFPEELSGGEKQRVAIARAVVGSPPLLLADEPSGSLDELTGDKVMGLLFDLAREKGMAMVLVTHNRELATRCHRVYRLEGGVLREQQ